MLDISNQILENEKSRHEIQFALAEILLGIKKEWELTFADLERILKIPQGTIKTWLNADRNGVVLNKFIDNDAQAVIDFIAIYDMIASFIVKTSDQIEWFKERTLKEFDEKSPLQMISENAHNLALARFAIARLINP